MKRQLEREIFIKGEPSFIMENKHIQPKNKKYIEYWFSCLWKYISKGGPKIKSTHTSIKSLKEEQLENWKYSKLILKYDLLTLKQTNRLLRKFLQREQNEADKIPATLLQELQNNQDKFTLEKDNLVSTSGQESNKANIGTATLKKKPLPDDDSRICTSGQKDGNNEHLNNKFCNASQLKQPFEIVDLAKTPNRKLDSDKLLFTPKSPSKSPESKLPPIPYDQTKNKTWSNISLRVSTSLFKIKQQSSSSQIKNKVNHTYDLNKNSNLNKFTQDKDFEDVHSKQSNYTSSVESSNIATLSSKDRNKRFLKRTRPSRDYNPEEPVNKSIDS